jgi:hypothetical protein
VDNIPRSSDVNLSSLWPSGPAGIGADIGSTLPSWLDSSASSALTSNPLWSSGPAGIGADIGSTLPSWPNYAGDPGGLNLSGLLPTSTAAALETYSGLVKSFPQPISSLNPLISSVTNVLERSSPWLTPSTPAELYDGLRNVLTASSLTELTNNLVSPNLPFSGSASPALQTLLDDFRSISDSYADIIQGFGVASSNPSLLAIPARGYFATGDALLSVHPEWSVAWPLQRARESAREEIQQRRQNKLELMLNKLDPRLYKLWAGAHLAAASTNPDRVRHSCVSIRELMTHVMHRLAPTEKVLAWNTDPRRLHQGKPTRKTRLAYICESVARGPLSEFVVLRIDSVVALADLVQKGTHGIGVEFSPHEMQLMFNAAEEALCSLIEIAEPS